MQSKSIPAELAVKMQRLIDLTALLERLNNKLIYGVQPSPKDYETLSDANREYGELLGQLSLRPPHRSS